jgi:hypothetical protein
MFLLALFCRLVSSVLSFAVSLPLSQDHLHSSLCLILDCCASFARLLRDRLTTPNTLLDPVLLIYLPLLNIRIINLQQTVW